MKRWNVCTIAFGKLLPDKLADSGEQIVFTIYAGFVPVASTIMVASLIFLPGSYLATYAPVVVGGVTGVILFFPMVWSQVSVHSQALPSRARQVSTELARATSSSTSSSFMEGRFTRKNGR